MAAAGINLPSKEEVQSRVDAFGTPYTTNVFKLARCKGSLTPEEAELYEVVQDGHFKLTGFHLPPVSGAKKTRTQVEDQYGPEVKDAVLDKAVNNGLAKFLKGIRNE